MTSQEESDEEYLDDPIQLINFRKTTETVTNHNQETSQTIFELTDPEGDLYIEKNNVFHKTIPYKKVSITLPVSFFELPQNVQLLNCCKQLSVKVVNCEKHPWYHKRFLSSNYSDNDEEVDFYNRKILKNMDNQNDVEGGMKIKIRPVSSPYENLKKDDPKNIPKRKETRLKQCVVAVSNPQVNFKKNQGLIGMKITQTPNKSLKIVVETKNITMADKTMETEKIMKDKAIVQEKKKKKSKNVKTVKNKEDASTSRTSATNVTKITDDKNKVIQNDVIGIGKFKDSTITKVDTHDSSNKVQSTNNLNIATETKTLKIMDKIGTAEPKVQKTNIKSSEKYDEVNLKNMDDKKIQNNTKAQLSNKLNTGNVAKTQEVTEKVYKFSTASKSKVPEIKDKTNQNNVKLIGNKTSSTLNSQKGKTGSNNANDLAKLNIVNNKHLTFDDSKKSVDYKNTALDQLVYSGGQLEEHLCSATNKEQYNPDTTYSAKLQGLKLTVTKKDSANSINTITKTSKIRKDTNRAKNTDTKRKVQKKTNSDPVKSIGNDSSSSLDSRNNGILNKLLTKPVKTKPKKCNADSKLIKPRQKIQKPVNLISSNSEINQAPPRLSNEIIKNDDLHVINYKCNNSQNSNECNYYPSNSGADKLSHLFDSKMQPAPVVGKSQSSSFYVHEYKKLMQSSSQHNPEQVDFKDAIQQVKVPLIYKTVEENTRPEVNQKSKPKIESLQASVNLRNDNLLEDVADNNHSNISAKQNFTNDMKPNPAVILNPSAPTSILNVNQNQDCFATGQSSACISKYTHVVQNQLQQIPLNIPTGKRCPRIIKINKRDLTVPNMKINEDSNLAAGLHLDAFDFACQRNDNNQRIINNYRIQDRPIQTLVTSRDNMPKQPLDLQQNQIHSQMLSNFYSAAQQVTRNSFIPNQNAQQLSNAHQMKQPRISPNIQTGGHLQVAGPQYKTSHEILPPTCDIALVKMTPVNDVQKPQHQNMPNIMCHPQQQRHNNISHTILRNESHLGRDRFQMQPNMKNASCQNFRNLKILVQEKPKTATRQNIYTVTPRQEINQNSIPFNYGFVHHQKISPHGQGFKQAFSEFSGFSPQNYINFAPIYDGSPNHMNPLNQMQNYWATYNPSIPPPPPPPPPLLPIYARGQVINQVHGPYQEYNNPSTPKSVAGTTIIGHDDSGPVRKININVEPYSKQNNTILQACEQGNFDNETNKSLKSSQGTDNKGLSAHSPVAYSKKEMLEELTKITAIESSNLSPVKDLKRPLPNLNTIQEVPNVKKYKPGPLSRKLIFESATAPQTNTSVAPVTHKPGPLSRKLIFESATAPQTNTSVAPVTHKGYSPPILPIPTYQKTLEILARSNISDPRLSHSITADDRKTESLNAMRSTINNKMEIVQSEKCFFDENQDKSAKKISLDEYKKRTSIIEDKNIKMEIKIENPEQDLGYDSDFTTKA